MTWWSAITSLFTPKPKPPPSPKPDQSKAIAYGKKVFAGKDKNLSATKSLFVPSGQSTKSSPTPSASKSGSIGGRSQRLSGGGASRSVSSSTTSTTTDMPGVEVEQKVTSETANTVLSSAFEYGRQKKVAEENLYRARSYRADLNKLEKKVRASDPGTKWDFDGEKLDRSQALHRIKNEKVRAEDYIKNTQTTISKGEASFTAFKSDILGTTTETGVSTSSALTTSISVPKDTTFGLGAQKTTEGLIFGAGEKILGKEKAKEVAGWFETKPIQISDKPTRAGRFGDLFPQFLESTGKGAVKGIVLGIPALVDVAYAGGFALGSGAMLFARDPVGSTKSTGAWLGAGALGLGAGVGSAVGLLGEERVLSEDQARDVGMTGAKITEGLGFAGGSAFTLFALSKAGAWGQEKLAGKFSKTFGHSVTEVTEKSFLGEKILVKAEKTGQYGTRLPGGTLIRSDVGLDVTSKSIGQRFLLDTGAGRGLEVTGVSISKGKIIAVAEKPRLFGLLPPTKKVLTYDIGMLTAGAEKSSFSVGVMAQEGAKSSGFASFGRHEFLYGLEDATTGQSLKLFASGGLTGSSGQAGKFVSFDLVKDLLGSGAPAGGQSGAGAELFKVTSVGGSKLGLTQNLDFVQKQVVSDVVRSSAKDPGLFSVPTPGGKVKKVVTQRPNIKTGNMMAGNLDFVQSIGQVGKVSKLDLLPTSQIALPKTRAVGKTNLLSSVVTGSMSLGKQELITGESVTLTDTALIGTQATIMPITETTTKQITGLQLKDLLALDTKSVSGFDLGFTTPPPPGGTGFKPPVPPPIFAPGWFDLGGFGSKGWRESFGTKKRARTPTILGAELGLKPSKQLIFTGLEERGGNFSKNMLGEWF